MDQILYIVVGVAIPVALLLCGILFWEVRRSMAVAKLYSGSGRDLRFVCALLRYYLPGGKWRILRNPCLLSDARGVPPRADLVVVGGGGVLILTVDDREGRFSTPPTGDWMHWQSGGFVKVPNRFVEGRQYTAVVNGLLVRAGVSCPVINLIVLSDDQAEADDLYGENVLTCNQLVPYVRRFCKGGKLSTKSQKRVREAIVSRHVRSKKALEAADAEAATLETHTSFTAATLFEDLPVQRQAPETVICPHCVQAVPVGNRFCGFCGAALRSEDSEAGK